MCQFISKLKNRFDSKISVCVILKNVKEIDCDGITVLLSVMIRFKSKHICFNGDRPRDAEVRKILNESKFFDHLYKTKFKDLDMYSINEENGTNLIVAHAMRTVDPELGKK